MTLKVIIIIGVREGKDRFKNRFINYMVCVFYKIEALVYEYLKCICYYRNI